METKTGPGFGPRQFGSWPRTEELDRMILSSHFAITVTIVEKGIDESF